MTKRTLNTICFIVSVVLFIWGLIITASNIYSTNLVTAVIGITYMMLGTIGYLFIVYLFNASDED